MTQEQKEKILNKYRGQYGQVALAILKSYLKGRPDVPGWREIYARDKLLPIPYNDRIIPLWTLVDYYTLKSEMPTILDDVDWSWPEIPTRRETVYGLEKELGLVVSKVREDLELE